MNTKICSCCKIEKDIKCFSKRKSSKDGHHPHCKDCTKEKKKKYYEENKEKILKNMKGYYKKHKKEIIVRNTEYYKNNKNHLMNKAKIRNAKRKQEDYIYKLKCQIRNMIKNSFQRKKRIKNQKSEKILGCTINFFQKHLLTTYKSNYGKEWDGIESVHIDHIIPLSFADTEEEIIRLCHYTNLQLLKAKDNLKKKDKIDWSLKK